MFILRNNLVGYISEDFTKKEDLYTCTIATDVIFNEKTGEDEICSDEVSFHVLEDSYHQEEAPTNIILRFSPKKYITYFEKNIERLENLDYCVFDRKLEDLNKDYLYQIEVDKDNNIISKKLDKNKLPNEYHMVDCCPYVPYHVSEIANNSLVFAIDIPEVNYSREFYESSLKKVIIDEIEFFNYK